MTEVAASSPTLVFVTYIRATPELVWEGITSNEFRQQYFHGSRAETSWEVGSPFRSYGPEGQLWGDDEILQYDPPKVLCHTWRSLYDAGLAAEPDSRVTWTVEVDPNHPSVTKLTVVHDAARALATDRRERTRVELIVAGLKTELETGRAALPDRPARRRSLGPQLQLPAPGHPPGADPAGAGRSAQSRASDRDRAVDAGLDVAADPDLAVSRRGRTPGRGDRGRCPARRRRSWAVGRIRSATGPARRSGCRSPGLRPSRRRPRTARGPRRRTPSRPGRRRSRRRRATDCGRMATGHGP